MSGHPVLGGDPRQMFDRVPFTRLLGLQRSFSEGGRARLLLPAQAGLANVIGAVHGGAVLSLLDVAMASAAVSARGFASTAVTLNLDTAFLAPGRGALTADAQLLHDTDGVAWCQAEVTDADGRTVARAHGSFRYLPLPPGLALPPDAAPPTPTTEPNA